MTTDIRHLLDKYFEGNSSTEEEQMLRRYFAQDNLPEELQAYTALFRFLGDESAALSVLNEIQRESDASAHGKHILLRKLRTIVAVAAVFLIAILLLIRPSSSPDESYAWVDGQRITDPATVREYAESSFGKVQPENDIIEDQLRFMLE
jgi:hypothetical protein